MNPVRLFLAFSLLLVAGPARATLIGDTVTIAHHCCALGTVATGGGPTNVTVESGSGDQILFYFNLYFVDVDAQSIRVDFNAGPNTFDSGEEDAFNGLVVSDLDWVDLPGTVTGFSEIDTNLAGWDDSRASFDDHSVAFNWELLTFTAASFFEATLEVQHVPEPGTQVLVLAGLLGVAAWRRGRPGA